MPCFPIFSIVSLITFQFGEQVFGSGKAPKQAYSVLYNCFGNDARGKKMPPKWKVINDTTLTTFPSSGGRLSEQEPKVANFGGITIDMGSKKAY